MYFLTALPQRKGRVDWCKKVGNFFTNVNSCVTCVTGETLRLAVCLQYRIYFVITHSHFLCVLFHFLKMKNMNSCVTGEEERLWGWWLSAGRKSCLALPQYSRNHFCKTKSKYLHNPIFCTIQKIFVAHCSTLVNGQWSSYFPALRGELSGRHNNEWPYYSCGQQVFAQQVFCTVFAK